MCFHATFKTADFRAIADENTSYITLEDDRNGITACAVHVPDDSAYAPSKEELGTIPAEVFSFGKITLPPAAVELLTTGEKDRGPSMQAEHTEIFRDAEKIFIYLDGARLYTFDDATTQEEQAYKKAQEEHEKEREDSTGEIAPEDVEKPWKDVKQEIDFAGAFRSFSYLWDAKTGAACIEYGNLYITSKKGIAVRFFGNRDFTTGNIGRWVNTWKTEKAGIFEQYAETGSAWINDQKAPLLDRPHQIRFNGEKRIAPLFPRNDDGEVLVFSHEAAPLARLLKKEKAGAFFSVGYKQNHLPQNIAFNVGAVKKSLAYFTTKEVGPVVSVCLRNGVYYLVITSDWKLLDGEFDIIPAQNVTEYSVLAFNFELNTLKPSKIAPKIDATENTAPNTPKEEKTEQAQAGKQETAKEETTEKPEQETTQEKRVKIAPTGSSAPLVTVPEPENRSAAADQNGPTAAEPEPVKAPTPTAAAEPSRADEPSGAEKPFEIGTYTTKKGKVKTAVKFNVTPRPEWVEALKKAFYWEYNGTWNGSPRKLPEIFKR